MLVLDQFQGQFSKRRNEVMCLLGRIRKTGEEIKSRRQKSDLSRNVVSTWVEGGDVRIGPEGV